MDLTTRYLTFELPHPFVPGAGPLSRTLDSVRRLEDAGAPMITLSSLFEEQIAAEQVAIYEAVDPAQEAFAESLSFLPSHHDFQLGPHEYLDYLQQVRGAVNVPVVASLNGSTAGGWLDYAREIEAAGASALELNVYDLATDMNRSGGEIELETIEIVKQVKQQLSIPVAVKLSQFYTSLPHFARRLVENGADGLIIFNRFYQPDVDVEELDVFPFIQLSSSSELLLRLRWLAILSGRIDADLAVTGGVHTHIDAVKALMCGAHTVQLMSVLLEKEIEYLPVLRDQTAEWLEEHEYESLDQMRGSMGLQYCPNPQAYERANYIRMLESWQ